MKKRVFAIYLTVTGKMKFMISLLYKLIIKNTIIRRTLKIFQQKIQIIGMY